MTQEPKLRKIEYWQQVRPPTLLQYLYRRAVKEEMGKVRGKTGVEVDPETKRLAPSSAIEARKKLRGLTADIVLAEHPEWKDDYERDILGKPA